MKIDDLLRQAQDKRKGNSKTGRAFHTQRFRNHTAMPGHIEAVSKPGDCLDMNANSAAIAIVDTYACCCGACCCDCETWSFTPGGTMANTVKNQTRCVTEGSAEHSGGAGSYVTLVPPPREPSKDSDADNDRAAAGAGAAAAPVEFTTVIETMNNEMSSCGYGAERFPRSCLFQACLGE